MRLLALTLALCLAGCSWFAPTPTLDQVAGARTRYVTLDYERWTATIDWCQPAAELKPGQDVDCAACGEVTIDLTVFQRLSQGELVDVISDRMKFGSMRKGEACKRKAVQ